MEPSETLLSCLCARELLRYSLAWRQDRKGVPFIPTEGRSTALWQHLVSDIAMQFGKGPTRGVPVGFPLLPTGFITPFPFGTFTDMGQVFQSNDRVRVLFRNARNDHSSCKGQDAHPLFCLEAIITLVVVAEGRSEIPGGFIQAFVAFPGPAGLALNYQRGQSRTANGYHTA